MRRYLSLLTIVSILAALCLAAPAAAEPDQRRRLDALARVDRTRLLVNSGSLAEAVRAAAELGGLDIPATLSPAADVAYPGLPATLQAPIQRLHDAVQHADDIARSALRVDVQAADALVAEAQELVDAAGGPALHDEETSRRLMMRGAGLQARIDAAVDREWLATATWQLAGVIDAELPALQAYGAAAPAPAGRVEGCDVVDQPPSLCVGGTGANTYADDYALVVDLGGDDLHTHSAGGADVGRNGLAASATIDVGGNDRYETLLTAERGRAAQGASRSSGIGMLVDAAGDDVYQATAAEDQVTILAQGGTIVGAGVLADLGGNDRYGIHNEALVDPDAAQSTSQGQGFSTIGPLGILLDTGLGNDSYAISVHPQALTVDRTVYSTQVRAEGQGYGVAGTGLFVDDGGTDLATVTGHTATVTADEHRSTETGNAIAAAVLGGLGGAGVAIGGPGDTTRTVRARTRGPAPGNASAAGFGYGALGGFAAISDTSGADVYRIDAHAQAVATRTFDDDCACDADPRVGASAAGVFASGLGLGGIGGIGLAHDAAGDDRYEVSGTISAEATAHDTRTASAPSPAVASALAGDATLQAMGFGSIGSGYLVDLLGDDTYDASTTSNAAAESDSPTDGERRSRAVSGAARSFAQGSGAVNGYGEQRDHGGKDRYTSTNISTATTDEHGLAMPFEGESIVQGAATNGAGLLLDIGGTGDVFTANPQRLTCRGTRGEGLWQDCGTGLGLGLKQ